MSPTLEEVEAVRDSRAFIPSGCSETRARTASFPVSQSSASSVAGPRVGGKTSSWVKSRVPGQLQRWRRRGTGKAKPTWKNSILCLGTLNDTSSTVLAVSLSALSTSTFFTSTVFFGRNANP